MKNFETNAVHFLESLQSQFENCFGDAADIELSEGVLSLELEDGGVYLINRHIPLQQIWLSSPQSGAWHFAPSEGGNWISTRGEKLSIFDILNKELNPSHPFHPAKA